MKSKILKPALLMSAVLTTSLLFAIDQVKLECHQLKKILLII
jgi:beta-glucosidase